MRQILSFIFILFLTSNLVNGQSTRKMLKKAIREAKENPMPTYIVEVENKHALVAYPTTYRGSSWFSLADSMRILTYNQNYVEYSLDSIHSLQNDTARCSSHDLPFKLLQSPNFGYLPHRVASPMDLLSEFYVKAKRLNRIDTLINGQRTYILKLALPNLYDKIISVQIHDNSETIWIDSASSRIIYYENVQYWDEAINYTNCSVWYPSQEEFAKELSLFQLRNQSAPLKYDPSVERIDWQVGDTMQITSFRTLKNDSFHLSSGQQNIYLLDFWYTSCGPCVRAIPQNNRLDSVLRQNNSQLLGVTVHHQSDTFLNTFAEKRNINYELLVVDSENHPPYFPILGYPTYILVNRQGIILYIESGASEKYDKKLEEDILAIIHAER